MGTRGHGLRHKLSGSLSPLIIYRTIHLIILIINIF